MKLRFNYNQIQLKRNEMKIDEKNMKNMFVNMVLKKYILKKT
jgi:hypothetical protein